MALGSDECDVRRGKDGVQSVLLARCVLDTPEGVAKPGRHDPVSRGIAIGRPGRRLLRRCRADVLVSLLTTQKFDPPVLELFFMPASRVVSLLGVASLDGRTE